MFFSSSNRCSVTQMRVKWYARDLRIPRFWFWIVTGIFVKAIVDLNLFGKQVSVQMHQNSLIRIIYLNFIIEFIA